MIMPCPVDTVTRVAPTAEEGHKNKVLWAVEVRHRHAHALPLDSVARDVTLGNANETALST